MKLLPGKFLHLILPLMAFLFIILPGIQARASAPAALQQLKDAEKIYRQQGPEAALPEFEQLRASYQQAGDTDSEGSAIRFIGEIFWRLGDFEKADQYLQQALTMKQDNGDRLQEGKTLNVLGLLNWDLGDYDAAKNYFQSGAAIATELSDNKLAGAILNNLGLVNDELGDYPVSMGQYQQALALYKDIDFPRGEGDTLGNIGGVDLLLGRFAEALASYEKALAISKQLQSVTSMSQDNGNIALSQLGLGQIDLALLHFEKAIDLANQGGMRQDAAYWQRGRAKALIRKGKYDLALEDFRLAMAAYDEIGAPAETLETLNDMGRLYLLLGDSASAETYFSDAMNKAREIGLARGITINLLALGDIQARQHAWEKSGGFYQEALDRSRESGEMPWMIQSLLSLSAIHQQQGEYDLAIDEAQQALAIAQKTQAQLDIAAAYYRCAELQRLKGDAGSAQIAFAQAEQASQGIPDPDLRWRIHYGKALAFDELDDQQAAIDELLIAVKLIEGVRNRLQEQRFRAGYIQDKYEVYVTLVRLQIETGQAGAAFSTAERLRARSFIELVENNTDISGANIETVDAIALQERIRQLRSMMVNEQTRERINQRQVAMNVYSSELQAAEKEYKLLLENRQTNRLLLDDSKVSLTYIPSYKEVRAKLSSKQALIEYVVGSDSVMVFVLTPESLLTETIPMDRRDLDSRIELLRDLIRQPNNDRWIKPAQKLAEALIGPIKQRNLLKDVTYLYLVPHGSLNYLPFALLPDGKIDGEPGQRLIVESYTLAYLPTAAALVGNDRPSTSTDSLLAIAPSRKNLKYAPAEAQSVNDMFEPDSNLLLGDRATESAFKNLAGDFSILHLATHGYFNKLNPLLSGLELEKDADDDGQLELYEILELQLNADLVTLSACQTALGSGVFSETPAGDDFVGLTRAFIYAGSQTVLATLWQVDDQSTMNFMQGFYTRLKQNNSDKALALALAQREMRSNQNYQHPYFWAPFILVGDSAENRPQRS